MKDATDKMNRKLFKQAVKMSIANWFIWCQKKKNKISKKKTTRDVDEMEKRDTNTLKAVNHNYWHKEWKRNEKQKQSKLMNKTRG